MAIKPTLPEKILSVSLTQPALTTLSQLTYFEKPSHEQKKEVPPVADTTPDADNELSYTATAPLMGQEHTKLQGFIMKDLVHIAIGVFSKEQIGIGELFEGIEDITASHIHFKQPRVTIDASSGMMIFSGFLHLDGPVLSLFREFLKIEYAPYIEATIDPKDHDLSKKIPLGNVSFNIAGNFYAEITPAVTLSEGGLMLLLEQDTTSGKWNIVPIVKGTLTFNNIAKEPVRMEGEISYANQALHIKAAAKQVNEIFGIEKLSVDNFKVSFQSGDTKNLSITADLVTPGQRYVFSGAIKPGFMALTTAVRNAFTFNDLKNLLKTSADYTAPDNPVTFENVHLSIASGDGKIGELEVKKGLQVSADITANNHRCKASAMITPDDIQFTGAVTDTVSIGDLHITQPEMELIYAGGSSSKKSGIQIKGTIQYESLKLNAGLSYKKTSDGWNALMYAAVANPVFRISDIVPSAKNSVVDTVKFSKATFVYAQKACTIEDLPGEDIKAGFQLKAVVSEFTPIQTLLRNDKKLDMKLELLLSSKNKSLHITMPEDTRLHLGEQVICQPFRIGASVDPLPQLSLSFPVSVKPTPKDQPLELDFSLKVGATDASASATVKGYWNNPFGVKGIRIGPALAAEIGINYMQFASTGTPSSLGIAGGLQLGDITGNMALKGSTAGKDQILYGEVEQLTPKNLGRFITEITGQPIPLDGIPQFFELKQLKIYCAPLGGSIGLITYEPGLSFVCQLVLFKKKISLKALVNDGGMQLSGEVDAFTLGPLELKGAVGKNAKVDVRLTTAQQSLFFDGRIELSRDIYVAAYLDISKDKAEFMFDYQLFDKLKYKVEGKSKGSLDKPDELDFELTAHFHNDICEYLKTELVQKIKDVRANADRSIDALKTDLHHAENAYHEELQRRKRQRDDAEKNAEALKKKMTEALHNAEAALRRETEQAEQRVASAKAAYDQALTDANALIQSTKATYDKAWTDVNNGLAEARRIYYAALKDAENTLNHTKAAYDAKSQQLRNKLNAAQHDVNQIDNELRHYSNLMRSCDWHDLRKQWYNAQIGACDVKKFTANAALSAARAALNLVDKTVEATSYFAANTAFEAARTGVNAVVLRNAEIAYQALEKGVQSFEPYKKAEAALEAIRSGNQQKIWQAAAEHYRTVLQAGQLAVERARKELDNIELTDTVRAFRTADAFLGEIGRSALSMNVAVSEAALSAAQSGLHVVTAAASVVARNADAVINIKKAELYVKLSELKQGKGFRCSMLLDAFGKQDIQWDLVLDIDVEAAKKLTATMYEKLMREAENILAL